MSDADYQKQRNKIIVLSAGALLLADTISEGLRAGMIATDGASLRVTAAFTVAEAFVAEAEKRLGGKIDLDD